MPTDPQRDRPLVRINKITTIRGSRKSRGHVRWQIRCGDHLDSSNLHRFTVPWNLKRSARDHYNLISRNGQLEFNHLIELECYWCKSKDREVTLSSHEEAGWFAPIELQELDWALPDLPVLEVVVRTFAYKHAGRTVWANYSAKADRSPFSGFWGWGYGGVWLDWKFGRPRLSIQAQHSRQLTLAPQVEDSAYEEAEALLPSNLRTVPKAHWCVYLQICRIHRSKSEPFWGSENRRLGQL